MRKLREPAILAGVLAAATLSAAWDPLWRNQPDIEEGVEAYQAKKWPEAQSHFERAAKEIPDTPELHLDRGDALYQQALAIDAQKRWKAMNDARDEFQRALGLDSPANKAAAWHNLSTSVTQLAMLQTREDKDKTTKPHDREERMALCKTAIDGFKKSLQLNSEDVDTKFNMEVAQRLLEQLEEEKKREEEEKKKKEEQEKKDQKKDDKKDDKKDQNKDQNKDQKKDQNKDQKKDQDQQKKEEEKKKEEQKKQQQKDQQDAQKKEEEQKRKEAEQKKEEEQEKQEAKVQKVPPLDLAPLEALKNSEKPLQLYRIMMDPRKSRINVKKDW